MSPPHPTTPAEGPLTPTCSYLLVSGSDAGIQMFRERATELRDAGHPVLWGYLAEDARGVRGFPGSHRFSVAQVASRPRRAALRTATGVVGPPRRLALMTRYDVWFRRAVRRSEVVVALDEVAEAALPTARALVPDVITVDARGAADVFAEQRAWDQLRGSLDLPVHEGDRWAPLADEFVEQVCTELAAVQHATWWGRLAPPELHQLIEHAVRAHQHGAALRLLRAGAEAPGGDAPDPLLTAYRAVSELTAHGATDADPVGTAAGVLEVADQALGTGDLDTVTNLATLALELVFHRELHSDAERSELIDDPSAYLEPLRDSTTWQALTAPVAPAPDVPPAQPEPSPARQRVAFLPGAYGTFWRPVRDALEAVPFTDVDVLDLPRRRRGFSSMGLDPALVRLRVQRTLGSDGTPEPDPSVPALGRADVIFGDWADKSALWASLHLAASSRLVIRVHSVDALRPWLHLIDWSQVDQLICVSEHILALVRGQLGERLAGTRCLVVPHTVDRDRFQVTRASGPPRVLCMVGWAQKVKDPLWTVELLARLSADGQDWRLLLVGHAFPASLPASGQAYAAAFRERAAADDVRDRIEYVPFTPDLPPVLVRAHFVVGSSIRESWHIGLVEAVAVGAVPVARQWPVFARTMAASALYPEEWVVDTLDEAVDRVRGLSGDPAWAAASAQAQRDLAALSPQPEITRAWQQAVCGDLAVLAQLTADGRDDEALALIENALAEQSTDIPLLHQAARSASRAGAVSLRLAVQQRLVDLLPGRNGLLRTLRSVIGSLRETSSEWTPTIIGETNPVEPVSGRVLHVLKVSMPHRQSGYSMRSRYLLSAQRQLGLDPVGVTALDFPTSLSSADGSGLDDVGGVPHHRLLRESVPQGEPEDDYLDAWASALAPVAQTVRPEIIHVHSGHRGFEGALVALTVGRALGVPVVYEVRGFFEALWSGDVNRAEVGETYLRRAAVEERCMRAASAVVTLSETMRADILSRGIDPDRVHVVPNGVDPEALTPVPRSPELAERLGLTGRFVFGYVSNLDHAREGHELLIEAAVALRDRGIAATALIVGEGRRRAVLEERVRDLGAQDVVVLTGQVPHEQVRDYYAQCDVFVVPRIDERAARLVTPLKPYEAMALEIPLVVSDLPALLELTGDGERGLSFRAGDVDSLVGVLTDLAADPDRRAQLARHGREWVSNERAWTTIAQRYHAVYQSVRAPSLS